VLIVACVHNPGRVLERCAPQKTSGVVDKRRYVHEYRSLEESAPGTLIIECVVSSFRPRKSKHDSTTQLVRHFHVRHGFRHLERALQSAQKVTISKTRSLTTARPMHMSPCGQPWGRQDTNQPGRGPQLQRIFTQNPSHRRARRKRVEQLFQNAQGIIV
jgi:hypothetical protein